MKLVKLPMVIETIVVICPGSNVFSQSMLAMYFLTSRNGRLREADRLLALWVILAL
ncbi:MAG: hypothetical protein NTW95_12270 [Candidatus Aminicenantes bacterium]|nr:hypothetical protein [Candidatus Aminicenantes bacterium]